MASFHLPLRSYEMLWLVMCCLWTTSTGQDCYNVSNGRSPEVRVSSTVHDDNWHSENPHPYLVEKGSDVTLTCTAKGPREGHSFQPYEINWFRNSRYLEMANCSNGKQSPVKTCNLTLRWPDVRGNYSCQAVNGNGCTYKKLELKVPEGRKPTIIKAPGNQSAHIWSNVTFNCTANGDPAPAVNWTKDGNLLPFNQKVMTNLTTRESQLVITGVTNEDIGQYRCVASNRMGRKESKAAVLSLMVVLPGGEEVIGKKEPSSSTSLIVGLCLGVLALVTCVVIGLLRYRRSRRAIEVSLRGSLPKGTEDLSSTLPDEGKDDNAMGGVGPPEAKR